MNGNVLAAEARRGGAHGGTHGAAHGVSAPLDRARLLIVDDDRMLLRILAEALGRRFDGAVIETCSAPLDAVAAVEARDFDVVVSDLCMGSLHGLELLSRVRAARPTTQVVLITGAADRDLCVKALRGGAYDFIQKPVDADYLVACVRRAIETRRLRAEVERQQIELRSHADQLERVVAERTEDLRRANRTKDEFLATVSHELRTPLTAILGWARLLCAGRLQPEEQAQAVESIARNARSQAQLIDDLLDVSRIITGKMRLEVRDVDLASILDGAIGGVLPAAQAKGIAIRSEVGALGPATGDADRLQQVLWNLLSNAVKFTPSGGRILARAERVADEIRIEISDTGSGIDPELLPYVFDRFRQGEGHASSRRGLGLGLAIAKHLVELHGGGVSAASRGTGQGTTFTVVLPSPQPSGPPSSPVRAPGAKASAGERCLRAVHVLVVDDEADTRAVLALMLEHAGATVRTAANGAEARKAFATAAPDILLCDIALGGEDGYALCRTLLGSHVGPTPGRKVHAVALTAHARSEDRSHALAAGFELHIAKPGPADLAEILAGLMDGDPDRNPEAALPS